jgi:tetratricopeptide (TPR) repeat protein
MEAKNNKSDDAETYYNLGIAYGNSGNPEKAMESFRKAIQLKPDYAEAYNGLGSAYGKSGDLEKAIELYKKAISLKPDYAKPHYNLGVTYGEKSNWEKAIKYYEEAIRIKADYPDVHNNLGVAYEKLGESKKAIESYKESIRITPDNASPHFNLGLSYIKSEEWENAIELLKEAIRLKPDYAEAHFSLGLAYAGNGYWNKAMESYKETIRIKPDYAEAHCGRGLAYLSIGDRGSALEEYKILKDLDKELANKLFNLINEPINKNTESARVTETPSYSAYLDIETTGFSSSSADITVIGIYLEKSDGGELIQLVGSDISSARLNEIFKNVNLLYTYNGADFDLPFIQTKLGLDLTTYCKHIDLMKECHERGIYGGLKETERKLGINRAWDLDGRTAVALWYKYKYEGNKEALDTLLKYNKEDAVNLSQIKRKLAAMQPNAEIRRKPHVEYPPPSDYVNEDELYKSHLKEIVADGFSHEVHKIHSDFLERTRVTKHTRVASSPQTALQQDDKPEKWYDNKAIMGCFLVIVVWCILAIIIWIIGSLVYK